ncbi:hypothetical protein CLV80_10596 [Yoonia maritima]|uniref:Secreted protein n=1 Tax=Yoonia maritima TaxID=1435347 RepID=A0A2T0VZ52_9RHOB|nr:hypothetical protein [Yoonia maritima]PRY77613.1 hypothetical protein CLV80_10596 [Yoonia maritima]
MTRNVLLMICLFLPLRMAAAPVSVQTGEHPNFTRMVFSIAEGADWKLGRIDDGYALLLPSSEGFDLRRFYDLIPRDRVAAVNQLSDDTVRIAVACDCRAEAFLFRPQILVVDIIDGLPQPGSPYEKPFFDDVETPNIGTPSDLPEWSFPLIIQAEQGAVKTKPVVVPELVPVSPDGLDVDLSLLEQTVIHGLADGLTRGVLDRNHPPFTGAIGEAVSMTEPEASNDHLPGVIAHNNLDVLAIQDDQRIAHTQSGNICPEAEYFEVYRWADERPFSTQIGEARSRITREFDQTDEHNVLRLAQIYVYFGFGVEALQALEIDGIHSKQRSYLAQLALIVDGNQLSHELGKQQVSCNSSVALWALLSVAEGPLDAQVDRSAVLTAFKALPSELRSHLSAELATRFVDMGDQDAAMQVLSSVPVDRDRSVEDMLAEISLSDAMGGHDLTADTLLDLAKSNSRITPNAMTEILSMSSERDIPVTPQDFVLADAVRFEARNSPAAAELAQAQFDAYLAQNHFKGALALISTETDSADPSTRIESYDALAVRAVSEMSDAVFVEFAFDQPPNHFSPEAQSKISMRLAELGFIDRAILFGMSDSHIATPPIRYSLTTGEDSTGLETSQNGQVDVDQDEIGQSALAGQMLGQVFDLETEYTDFNHQSPIAGSRALLDRSSEVRDAITAYLEKSKAAIRP